MCLLLLKLLRLLLDGCLRPSARYLFRLPMLLLELSDDVVRVFGFRSGQIRREQGDSPRNQVPLLLYRLQENRS